jgi:hypothetical protein
MYWKKLKNEKTNPSIIFCLSSLSSARILIFNNSCLVMVDSNSASTASLKPCCPTITIDLKKMKKLTNNQKKFLRARGHTLKSIVMVGQHGLSEAVLAELESTMTKVIFLIPR